MIQTTKSKLPA